MRSHNSERRLLKVQSKTQKPRLATILLVCGFGLVLYAAGIATNFFASPVFSMFFVISYQTAHSIVVYVAVAAAFALAIVAAAVSLSMVETPKKRKEPIAPRKVPSKKPIIDPSPTSTFKMVSNLEKEKTEGKAREPRNQSTNKQSSKKQPVKRAKKSSQHTPT